MVQVICTLPNASEEISGVKFSAHDEGMISEEISQEVADSFLEVSHGYKLAGEVKATKQPSDEEKAARDALLAKAAALGLTVNTRWSTTTLADRVAAAEAEAAEKLAAEEVAKAAEQNQ